MAFRGPSRGGNASVYDRIMAGVRERPEDDTFAETPRASGGGGVSRIDTDFMDRMDRQEGIKAQLAMTPGVRRGGSTATRPQSDSPLNVGATQRFERFGDTYNFDPMQAAAEEGRGQATAQNAADKERYSALLNTNGINPRQAAKLVYGRGDILDTDTTELRDRLAAYTRAPSRAGAADAVAVGANPGQFGNLRAAGEELPDQPVRGEPRYFDTLRKEEGIRTDATMREIQLRADTRPEQRDRVQLVREKGTGRMLRLNLETGEVEPTEAVTDTPRSGGPGAILSRFGLQQPSASDMQGDAPMRVAPRRSVPPGTGMASIEDEARQLLAQKGIDDPSGEEFDDMKALIALKRARGRRRGAP